MPTVGYVGANLMHAASRSLPPMERCVRALPCWCAALVLGSAPTGQSVRAINGPGPYCGDMDGGSSEAVRLVSVILEGRRASHIEMMGSDPFEVLAVVERTDAVAVVMQNETIRITVIADRYEGDWRVPTMLSGTRRRNSLRSAFTGPIGLQERNIKRVRRLAEDEAPRGADCPWIALTRLAALDVAHVVVSTEFDIFQAIPASDGFVLALIRSDVQSDPDIVVHTNDGREVRA